MTNISLTDCLSGWHRFADTGDLNALKEITHPEAILRSPVAHTVYEGRGYLLMVLAGIVQVFEDFTYHRTFLCEEERSVTLEFSATVNGKQLKGVDLIRFDEAGQITELEVAVRPLSAVKALQAAMEQKLAATPLAAKG